jgi:formate/nitrite transporter FocA (FNT family)
MFYSYEAGEMKGPFMHNHEEPEQDEMSPKSDVEQGAIAPRVRPADVYDAILEEGEEELERGFGALWWSGIAAGLSMGFSVVASAALAAALGHDAWVHPIVSIGYTAGFIIVILARQQLFTENTITALLPVITNHSWATMVHMLRLWGIVFVANIVGAFIFAWATQLNALFTPELRAEFLVLGEHLFANSPMQMFVKGIAAGWLIAALVWVLPSLKGGKFLVIMFFTWLIALGGFTHIIAGSIESFHMLFVGAISPGQLAFDFMIPTLLGNIMGGSAIFSLISYAQVRREVDGV